MNTISLKKLQALKTDGRRFATVTAYDASFAKLVANAKIECLLVGDSLGNVIQGNSSTVPVSIDEMCYHTACVHEGLKSTEFKPLLMTDMPFMSYSSVDVALENATSLMQSGAQMVKVEGGEWLADSVATLTERGISVCAHLGLTPQSVDALGGYHVQGRDEAAASQLIHDARALQSAGAGMLVLECIPSELGQRVSNDLHIPVIGIGAGPFTDSQVLVLYDMLGMNTGHVPRFVKNYMESANDITSALVNYREEVINGYFPAPEHCYDI